jgi:hypothetical protein
MAGYVVLLILGNPIPSTQGPFQRNYRIKKTCGMGEKQKQYYRKNKKLIQVKRKFRRENPISEIDKKIIKINYNLRRTLITRTVCAFKWSGFRLTNGQAEYLIGDIDGARKRIESLFKDGMDWDNKGKWVVDHIKPLSKSMVVSELIKRCYFENTQPLWAIDNLKKFNKELV